MLVSNFIKNLYGNSTATLTISLIQQQKLIIMKARLKATGEIIELADYCQITLDKCDSWGNPIELKPEEVELIPEQENADNIDWKQRRYELAKAAMQGMISSWIVKPSEKSYANNIGCLTEMSFDVADAMIKELKESEETK